MWLCLNNAFLSIVEPNRADKGASPVLKVRARRPGDIERVFPGYDVLTVDGRDYQFRAMIPREVVASAVAAQVLGINYDNFKDSVADRRLHDAYATTWHTMANLQPQRPYRPYSLATQQRPQHQAALPLVGRAAPRGRAKRTTGA